jgi:hypothetical protein
VAKIIEWGIKEGECGGWFAWGLTVFRWPSRSLYLTLPGACRIIIVLRDPVPPTENISPGSNWYWLEIQFRCYRFIALKIEIPVIYKSKKGVKLAS